MLHQIVLGGNQHWAAKGIQIRVMQLVWQPINFIRCFQVDVSDATQRHHQHPEYASSSLTPTQTLTWLLLAG